MLKWGSISQSLYARTVERELQMTEGLAAMAAEAGSCPEDVIGAVCLAVNRLAAMGRAPEWAALQFTIPADLEEKVLKAMTSAASACLGEMGVQAGETRVFAAGELSMPVTTAIVSGGQTELLFGQQAALAGQDIVMAGYAAQRGTVKLAAQHREELLARFNPAFIAPVLENETNHSYDVLPAVKIAADQGASAMYAVGDGGVFTALWEMAKRGGLGLCVRQKAIPIRRETIEICDFLDKDPYQILGTGALLIATDHGQLLMEELAGAGIPAAVIGFFTDNADRVIISHEEKRFLEPFRYERVYENEA